MTAVDALTYVLSFILERLLAGVFLQKIYLDKRVLQVLNYSCSY